ncbi:retropepsin-like aspartic protease [Thiohalorhabdus methylotrophus]|uniref:Retropepsin-like aspartic protease n=1 Tax=Thiohalorhabdus methylotrophus TaxID=3242694 RepID=A0ABV4TSB0_9GAMM
MTTSRVARLVMLLVLAAPLAALAEDTQIPMRQKKTATFYVPVQLGSSFSGEFLVDTGSSHMAIRESTLRDLQEQGHARFVKNLAGRMADGSRKVVPVYRIDQVRIGKNCLIEGVEAAVFPDSARPILGLSALRQAAPVRFSMNPPTLQLSRCGGRTAATGGSGAVAQAESRE